MLYIKTTTAANRLKIPNAIRHDINVNYFANPDKTARRLMPNYSVQANFEYRLCDTTNPVDIQDIYDVYREDVKDDFAKDTECKWAVNEILRQLNDQKTVILAIKENKKFRCSLRRVYVELFYQLGITDIITDDGIDLANLASLPAV